MTHRFIPVNLLTRPRRPLLAVVDVKYLTDEVGALPWRTDELGRVYRQFLTPSTVDKPQRRIREQLAVRSYEAAYGKKTHPRRIVWLNHDPLDCRAENLAEGSQNPKTLKPGTVVSTLSGYLEAFDALSTAQLPIGRPARLNNEQVRRLLDECMSGFLKGESLNTIQLWVEEALGTDGQPGPTIHISQLRNMLNGKCQRIPGFDYLALQSTRPRRYVNE